MKLLKELLREKMEEYFGPKGYGANPEFGGNRELGERRMQSLKPFDGKLTDQKKKEIEQEFKGYDVEIKKIDKTKKGFIRIWYNGSLWK